ncbi:MAG: glucose-6-phosphate 1-dehydrogenase [Parcubacteria group bacterium Gr01-1014_30]|nr:MAG: glucose-6-phosphate 1-dehydrogenase [Parcubacteria group bacterium Gr01-1014_30]
MRSVENALKNFPTVLIIFGATGDFMERKLLPAIFDLHQKGFLPTLFRVIGFAKENLTEVEYRSWLRKNFPKRGKRKKDFLQKFTYQAGLFEEIASYEELGKKLGFIDGRFRVCANKLFYLAVPPNYYEAIFQNLAKSGLTKPCSPEEGWTRVLVEKPFGEDLEKAKKLDKLLDNLFKEVQVYRIDHYLAKETVSNLLVFRFANSVFEHIWNRRFIEKIEIRLLEKEGVENRGLFYDTLGALRDVGQNHLLQMLALVTIDAPLSLTVDDIREKKLEILQSLQKMTPKGVKANTARGQYQGYLQTPGVKPDSRRETYFKIKTFLKNKKWKGVPFILESGKRMNQHLAEIKITFKIGKYCPFCKGAGIEQHSNTLTFRIHPKEGILFSFHSKKPGTKTTVETRDLHFFYEESYQKQKLLPDYEKLLVDAFLGDQTLFLSTKEILACWGFIDPILRAWQKNAVPLKVYKAR